MAKACRVVDASGECINVVDKETGDGFCRDHSHRWRQSEEFNEAVRDPGVAFATQLRMTKLLNTALRPFKKRWVKRMQSKGEE